MKCHDCLLPVLLLGCPCVFINRGPLWFEYIMKSLYEHEKQMTSINLDKSQKERFQPNRPFLESNLNSCLYLCTCVCVYTFTDLRLFGNF